MGCDYYIIQALIITHKKNDSTDISFIKLDRFKMYLMCIFSYNWNKDNCNKLVNREIDQVADVYSNMDRTIYEKDQWKIQDLDIIDEYLDHVRNKNIDWKSVIKIEKKHLKMRKNITMKTNV